MNRILGLAVTLLLISHAHAQSIQSSLAPNMVSVCDEVCTVTAAPATAIYQFGADTSWSAPATQTLPLVADCSHPCAQFGGDPDVNVGKALYVQQQAHAFTVTWTDGSGAVKTTPIPALVASAPPPTPALNDCPPAPFDASPATPAAPANCTLPAGAVKVGDDGTLVTILLVAAPVHMVYCATAPGASAPVCNRPVFFGAKDPFLIGPTALLGGPPIAPASALGTPTPPPPGSLYILPGVREVTLTTAVPGPPQTIPAATAPAASN